MSVCPSSGESFPVQRGEGRGRGRGAQHRTASHWAYVGSSDTLASGMLSAGCRGCVDPAHSPLRIISIEIAVTARPVQRGDRIRLTVCQPGQRHLSCRRPRCLGSIASGGRRTTCWQNRSTSKRRTMGAQRRSLQGIFQAGRADGLSGGSPAPSAGRTGRISADVPL